MRRAVVVLILLLASPAAAADETMPVTATLSGPGMEGETLTCGAPEGAKPASAFRWYRSEVAPGAPFQGRQAIPGAANRTYTPRAEDASDQATQTSRFIACSADGVFSEDRYIFPAGSNAFLGTLHTVLHGSELGCRIDQAPWVLGRGPWTWTFEFLKNGKVVSTSARQGDPLHGGGFPVIKGGINPVKGPNGEVTRDPDHGFYPAYSLKTGERQKDFTCRVTLASPAGKVVVNSWQPTETAPVVMKQLELINVAGLPPGVLVRIDAPAQQIAITLTAKSGRRTVKVATGQAAIAPGVSGGKYMGVTLAFTATGKRLLKKNRSLPVKILALIDGKAQPPGSGKLKSS